MQSNLNLLLASLQYSYSFYIKIQLILKFRITKMKSNQRNIKQVSLQQDLNALVQVAKNRQNQSYALVQYLQDIMVSLDTIQQTLYLQDLILKHKNCLYKAKNSLKQSQLKQNQIFNKCGNFQICGQQYKSLIRRVGARIIQIFQMTIDQTQKYPHFINQIFKQYKVSKLKFLKLMNLAQKDQGNLTVCQIFRELFNFSSNQFEKQIRKLQIIIELLEEGETQQISQFFDSLLAQNQKKNKEELLKKQKQKLPQNDYTKQKHAISTNLKRLREQSKLNEAIKKKKCKLANKLYNLYNSAMEISKNQFIQDLTFLNKQQKIQRLMTDITLRNKNNEQYIKQFQEKTETFQQKVSNFKKSMLYQNQIAKLKLPQKGNNIDSSLEYRSLDYSGHEQNNQRLFRQQMNQSPQIDYPSDLEKIQSKSFRITYNNKKQSVPVIPKSNVFHKHQKLSFVKINFQSEEQPIKKPKLPDISSRVFSMQNRRKVTRLTLKQDQFKDQIKMNLIKNIEIDLNRLKKGKQSGSGKRLALQKKCKSTAKARQINYCSSVCKKINKFVQLVSAKNYA